MYVPENDATCLIMIIIFNVEVQIPIAKLMIKIKSKT